MKLSNFAIGQKLLIAVLPPTLLALVLAILVGLERFQTYQLNQQTLILVELSELLDGIAHEHAVERGLTAGFLGSNGRLGLDKVHAQRVRADAAEDALVAFTTSSAEQLERQGISVEKVLAQLNRKSATRQQVEQLDPTANAFQYYSELNQLALTTIEKLANAVNNPLVAAELTDLVQLLWLKERAGQSRGLLNGLFAAGKSNAMQYAQVNFYIMDFNNYWRRLNESTNTDLLAELRGFSQTQEFDQANAVESEFLAQADNLPSVDGPSPATWFPLATQRIKGIKTIADTLEQAIHYQAEKALASSQFVLLIIVSVMILLTAILIWLATAISRDIAQRLERLKTHLMESVTTGDISQQVQVTGTDEIAAIGNAVNEYIDWLRSVVQSIANATHRAETEIASLNGASEQNSRALSRQQQETTSAVTGIQQMNASAQAVASSCHQAATLSSEAQQGSLESRKMAEQAASVAASLSDEVKQTETIVLQLTDHSNQIGSILDTIRGIAEQTNLLALNATIEAARAGEQGRGFAVVADEVRNLAQRTQESTTEIQNMISTLQESSVRAANKIRHSNSLVDDCATNSSASACRIEETYELILNTKDQMIHISSATEQQSNACHQLAANLQAIDAQSTESNQLASNLQQRSEQLATVFNELRQQTLQFKL